MALACVYTQTELPNLTQKHQAHMSAAHCVHNLQHMADECVQEVSLLCATVQDVVRLLGQNASRQTTVFLETVVFVGFAHIKHIASGYLASGP